MLTTARQLRTRRGSKMTYAPYFGASSITTTEEAIDALKPTPYDTDPVEYGARVDAAIQKLQQLTGHISAMTHEERHRCLGAVTTAYDKLNELSGILMTGDDDDESEPSPAVDYVSIELQSLVTLKGDLEQSLTT